MSYSGGGCGKLGVVLPGGYAVARQWGRSRGLELVVLDEVLTCEADCDVPIAAGVRTVRSVGRWLCGELGWKFRGGAFVSWGDRLTGRLVVVVRELRGFYGVSRPWGVVDGNGEGGAR